MKVCFFSFDLFFSCFSYRCVFSPFYIFLFFGLFHSSTALYCTRGLYFQQSDERTHHRLAVGRKFFVNGSGNAKCSFVMLIKNVYIARIYSNDYDGRTLCDDAIASRIEHILVLHTRRLHYFTAKGVGTSVVRDFVEAVDAMHAKRILRGREYWYVKLDWTRNRKKCKLASFTGNISLLDL